LALAFNPSHLEIVSPVVQGSVRARQDIRNDSDGQSILPVILHGDAAFSGQGVVMETLQMSQTRAYKTGGTIHIIINNQVGFTTHKKEDARSTYYASDVAKVIEAPVFHVNADDPEAVIFIARMAMNYREKFKKDIVIDLVCYRRRGHNEADEPFGTQPKMYHIIKNHPTTLALYSQHLIKNNDFTPSQTKKLLTHYRNKLMNGEKVVHGLIAPNERSQQYFDWSSHLTPGKALKIIQHCSKSTLQTLATQMCQLPAGFQLQKQVQKLISDRKKMISEEQPINWGFAETLAYATILEQGYSIRLSGQDVGRGTFSHRHCTLHAQTHNNEAYIPLQHLKGVDATFDIYDSLLSELAVLGFEYGYSTTNPKSLVIWEAQFGDFANGAQMIIDQFITSGEHKWGRLSGLTMLLPHGYEGQGPEHSSARLERFLQLCAEYNIQVCVPTTPAQIFHLLRRQIITAQRKPLIIMSPKSLLRSKSATSSLEDLSSGQFQSIIDETKSLDKMNVIRIVLCSGRVYYDLLKEKEKQNLKYVSLIRIEQLYPFPTYLLKTIFKEYPKLNQVIWSQEEPKNQGAWYSSQHHLREVIKLVNENIQLDYAGREASAAPAAGYMKLHTLQLKSFIQKALYD
jgi:2-oxoglutarate dehydrogenase E1 component